jgi:transposase
MKETKNKRIYDRYQAIYLYLQDYAKEDIDNIIGRLERTIYNYVNAYTESPAWI